MSCLTRDAREWARSIASEGSYPEYYSLVPVTDLAKQTYQKRYDTRPFTDRDIEIVEERLDAQAQEYMDPASQKRIESARLALVQARGARQLLEEHIERVAQKLEADILPLRERHAMVLAALADNRKQLVEERKEFERLSKQLAESACKLSLMIDEAGDQDYLMRKAMGHVSSKVGVQQYEEAWDIFLQKSRVEKTVTGAKKATETIHRLTGKWMGFAPWISGALIGYGMGILLKLITEKDVTPSLRPSLAMLGLYAFGVMVSYLIGGLCKRLGSLYARSTSKGFKPFTVLMSTLVAALIAGEIYADTAGLMFGQQTAAARAAFQGLPFEATPAWQFVLVAIVVSVPYFGLSLWAAYDAEREVMAKEALRLDYEAARAKAEELFGTKDGQVVIRDSNLATLCKARIANLEAEAKRLETEKATLEGGTQLDPETKANLQGHYRVACEYTCQAQELASPGNPRLRIA